MFAPIFRPPEKKMSERPAPPRLADFPHHVTDKLRYSDMDGQGHVNNAVFSTFFESGRVGIVRDPVHGFLVPGTGFALVRVVIDYLGELRWPGEVTTGTRIKRLGTSSLTFAQAVFAGERCMAAAETTVVQIDTTTRRPRPFPDDVAARIRSSLSG
jgi:acyl-CoA thioester hydrolase